MIIENKQRNIETAGEVMETNKMTINIGVHAHIIKVLTEASYKKPFASSVREALSNALDSHTEAGVDDPIIVKISKDEIGMYNLEIQDFGLGLDDKEFRKYIMGVGESTKRDNPNVLGGYGLGAKAPLSMSDNYWYICRKNKVERKFMIFKGAELPEDIMLYEKPTEERNGVTVIIPLTNMQYKLSPFISEIKEQAAYFSGIYFDCLNMISNDYKIYRHEDWQISGLNKFNEMHICLKDVYYPIEWNKLGIQRIRSYRGENIGLRFETYEGVQPVFNREELIYTNETKEIILNKIRKVSDWFINKYNSEIIEETSFIDSYYKIGNEDPFIEIDQNNFFIEDFETNSQTKILELKITEAKVNSPSYYKRIMRGMFPEYEILAVINNNKILSSNKTKRNANVHNSLLSKEVLLIKNPPLGNLREFLKEKYDSGVIVRKNETAFQLKNNRSSFSYEEILNLSSIKKEKWRETIKEVVVIKELFLKKIIDITEIENTDEYKKFLQEKKDNNKKERQSNPYKGLNKQNGDVTVSFVREALKGGGYTVDKAVYKVEVLKNQPHLFVYFSPNQKDKAIEFFNLYDKNTRIIPYIIGEREANKIKKLKNFIKFEEFMTDKVKPFMRTASSILFAKEIAKYNKIVSNNKEEIIKNIVTEFYTDIELMREYVKENVININLGNTELYNQILSVAEDKDLYDKRLWDVYKRVKDNNDKYEFIQILSIPSDYNAENLKIYKTLIYRQLLFMKKYYNELKDYELVKIKPEELVEDANINSYDFSHEIEITEELFNN